MRLLDSLRFALAQTTAFSHSTQPNRGGLKMTNGKKGLTRRRFLEGVGLAGGSAAMYETMTALGLINLPEAWAGPPELPQDSGRGKSVVILGAGIAGMTAAYELTRANYSCKIIELTERAGG